MSALFASKKFKVALAAIMVSVAGGLTGELSWEKVIMASLAIAVSYIIAQGAADIGKEKAKAEAK